MSEQTEIIRASEVEDLCLRILELREPGTIAAYERALSKYERDLTKGGHTEVDINQSRGYTVRGYVVIGKDGQAKNIQRPRKPTPVAYIRWSYDRSFGTHARTSGLLADARFNRDLRHERVVQYAGEMAADRWRDLLSDPISITADGQVLNGQHRIAAASRVDWSSDPAGSPKFLVVWNVDPREAQHVDGSRRTPRDQKRITDKLLTAADGHRG